MKDYLEKLTPRSSRGQSNTSAGKDYSDARASSAKIKCAPYSSPHTNGRR